MQDTGRTFRADARCREKGKEIEKKFRQDRNVWVQKKAAEAEAAAQERKFQAAV